MKNWNLNATLIGILAIFLFSNANAAESSSTSANIAPYRVGTLYWSDNIHGQVAMRRGLETTAEDINAKALEAGTRTIELIANVAGDGPEGIEKQILQMNRLLDQKPDLIIVQPTDNLALSQALIRANKENVPVIAYDQEIKGPGKLDCLLTSNNYQAGFQCGEYTAHQFDNSTTLMIIMVEYPRLSSAVDRVKGFTDGLTAQKQPFRVVRTYEALAPEAGERAGNNILRRHPMPKSIDVIFTVNDGGGVALVEALLVAGRSDIAVATVGGNPKSVQNIHNGNLTIIDSAQFCWHLGSNAMLAGYQLLQGKKDLPPTILLPVFPVTSETLEMYQGWYGAIPEPFTKTWDSIDSTWEWQLTTPGGDIFKLDD